ncbi:sigma-70 family RNA polymerase sigma factor [Intrasporangium sp.]|uniref:RNA polymerase sigma factor n=1 Tax=Intrasporangium sp. TaxID=1925024 RepID=UPI003221D93B
MRHPFEQAVAQHGGVVLRVCRAVLGPVDADDAWSETFLAALRAWPDLPDDADVRAWLVTIAHHKAVDLVRARRRAPVPVPVVPEPAGRTGGDTPALPDDDLWHALAALPDKQRRCVAYHHVAGLSHPEVAAIVGGTAAAARRASADGIAALRRTYLPTLERETRA